MKRVHVVVAVLLLLGSVSGEGARLDGTKQPKPTVVEVVRATPAPPLTLDQAFAEASAVLQVQIGPRQPVPYVQLSDLVRTDYICKVLRVLKGNGSLEEQTVVVRRSGGMREEPTRILRVVVFGFPDFAENEQYVLFLRQYAGESWLVASAEGTFQLRGDQVMPIGVSAFAKREGNQLASDFQSKLLALRDRIK